MSIKEKIESEVSRLKAEKVRLEGLMEENLGRDITNYYEPYDKTIGKIEAYVNVLEWLWPYSEDLK